MKYAAILFIVALFRTFFSDLFPDEFQAKIWNIGASVSIIILVYMYVWIKKDYLALIVAGWWSYEESLVIIGSIARLTIWKNLPVSNHQTSDLIGLPLQLISIGICAGIAVLIYKEEKSAANDTRP